MSDFVSTPPSRKQPAPKGFFQGGMMPATTQDLTAMIVMDLRSLRLPADMGKRLESDVREFLFKRLEEMDVKLTERSAIDLSCSVFGISIE